MKYRYALVDKCNIAETDFFVGAGLKKKKLSFESEPEGFQKPEAGQK